MTAKPCWCFLWLSICLANWPNSEPHTSWMSDATSTFGPVLVHTDNRPDCPQAPEENTWMWENLGPSLIWTEPLFCYAHHNFLYVPVGPCCPVQKLHSLCLISDLFIKKISSRPQCGCKLWAFQSKKDFSSSNCFMWRRYFWRLVNLQTFDFTKSNI